MKFLIPMGLLVASWVLEMSCTAKNSVTRPIGHAGLAGEGWRHLGPGGKENLEKKHAINYKVLSWSGNQTWREHLLMLMEKGFKQ